MVVIEGWQFIVIAMISLILFLLWIKQRSEFFANAYNEVIPTQNSGPEIYERHPMQVSVLEDVRSKYTKAYNYELDNKAYLLALQKTFAPPPTLCISPNEWGVAEPVNMTLNENIKTAYKYAIAYIHSTIKSSPFFVLPDNLPTALNNIQMLHDVLVSYQNHKRLSSYILTLQFVFYREAKYHAKDVGMVVRVDKQRGLQWRVSVQDIWINGVIFEDKIAMFPINSTDPYDTNINRSHADFIDKDPSKYLKRGFEFCALNDLDKDKAALCANALDMRALDDDRF